MRFILLFVVKVIDEELVIFFYAFCLKRKGLFACVVRFISDGFL